MANYVSNWHIQKRMQMEWYANTHTLSKYHMLNLTILANDIIYDKLY